MSQYGQTDDQVLRYDPYRMYNSDPFASAMPPEPMYGYYADPQQQQPPQSQYVPPPAPNPITPQGNQAAAQALNDAANFQTQYVMPNVALDNVRSMMTDLTTQLAAPPQKRWGDYARNVFDQFVAPLAGALGPVGWAQGANEYLQSAKTFGKQRQAAQQAENDQKLQTLKSLVEIMDKGDKKTVDGFSNAMELYKFRQGLANQSAQEEAQRELAKYHNEQTQKTLLEEEGQRGKNAEQALKTKAAEYDNKYAPFEHDAELTKKINDANKSQLEYAQAYQEYQQAQTPEQKQQAQEVLKAKHDKMVSDAQEAHSSAQEAAAKAQDAKQKAEYAKQNPREVYGKEKVDENGNPIQKPGKAPNYGEKPMAAFIQHAQKNYPDAWQGDSTPADWIEQAKKMGLDPSVAYQKIEARMKAIQDQKNKQRGFLGNILHSLTKDPGAL